MPAKRRPRPCESCRSRHLKCDNSGDSSRPCANCKRSDITCIQAQRNFRFKNTKRPKRTAGFSADQPWVVPECEISFLSETPAYAEVPEVCEEAAPDADYVNERLPPSPSLARLVTPLVGLQQVYASDSSLLLPTDDVAHFTTAHGATFANSLPIGIVPIGLQEACLIRHFVENLAYAFDASDQDRHFSVIVPQRAIKTPVLLYAICTASARHLTSLWYKQHTGTATISFDSISLPGLDAESAIHYHNACLSLLKDFTRIPPSEANAEARADALAATTILRFYEELDASLTGLDSETYQGVVRTVMCTHHAESLFTLQSIENQHRSADGRLVIAEGLRSSACLIALRQEIWSVILYRRPFRLPISTYLDYSRLGHADDFAWTNRAILWCADVLRFCFGPDTSTHQACNAYDLALERWDAMKAFEVNWTSSPPSCFSPLYHVPPEPSHNSHFPSIWQIHSCQVLCLQHLELGRMLLNVYNPRRQRIGIGSSAINKTIESQLRQSVILMCGLALGNKKYQPGMTTAVSGILIGGEYFHKREEQEAIIDFLRTVEQEHAWPTKAVVLALRGAWNFQGTQPATLASHEPASV